jgi:hypothetical protein
VSPGESNEALMRVTMVTGVRNDEQPGTLERQRGGTGAGVTELKLQCLICMMKSWFRMKRLNNLLKEHSK